MTVGCVPDVDEADGFADAARVKAKNSARKNLQDSDAPVQRLRALRSRYRQAGKLREAKAVDRAIAVLSSKEVG